MANPVPADDLPSNLVPAGDLPSAPTEPKKLLSFADRVVLNGVGRIGAVAKPMANGYDVGGLVTDYAAKVLPPKGAAALGVGANMAFNAVPALVGGAMAPGANAMRAGGRSLMQRALKPTYSDLLTGKADRAAQTMLDEGLNVNRGGVSQLRTMGSDINSQVQGIVNSSTATISKGAPASRIADEITALEHQNWLPNAQRTAMEGVQNAALSNPLVPNAMPLSAAQRYKQALYQGLKDDYGTLSTGEELARKALARGLREEIERAAPEVAPLNKRASEIWNALNVTERRALLAGNKNLFGLSTLARSPEYQAWYMLDSSPLAQSMLARSIYNSGRAPGLLAGGTGSAAMAIQKPKGQ